MKTLLLTGARERPNGFELGDGKFYDAARLVKLNLETGDSQVLLSVEEGNTNYPAEHANLQFTAGQVEGNRLWLPTDTEIRCYRYPTLSLECIYSHPFFQNVHSVHVIDEDLVVTCTGLDMVAILDKHTGECKSLHSVEGKEVWHRFDQNVDYRQVYSTRPHQGHPNYVYRWKDRLWITRCTQEDAVCLDDISQRINISGDDKSISVHDGHLHRGQVYFTSVDGWLLIGDPDKMLIVQKFNLNDIAGNRWPRGWCRGICLDGDLIYVAYSRLRKTRTSSRIAWLKNFVQPMPDDTGASVVAYNLKVKRMVYEYRLPEDKIHAIYSLLPEPRR